MEQKFNAHHGAVKRQFRADDRAHLKTYSKPQKNWGSGKVLKRLEKVLYEVGRQKGTVIRHANQLRKRFVKTGEDTSENPFEGLSETIILDESAE
ncbi:unnamed protein product [Gongylonema pulchrum]|uniref:Transposase n=1 Tax=Gongylonema pulchrum TaxID=637853 RepID=A0A183F1P7_9BILA|nr:unnamed protein product [Gongylonema pulchrum]